MYSNLLFLYMTVFCCQFLWPSCICMHGRPLYFAWILFSFERSPRRSPNETHPNFFTFSKIIHIWKFASRIWNPTPTPKTCTHKTAYFGRETSRRKREYNKMLIKGRRSSASADKTARPSLYETSQFRQILAIKLNWITNSFRNNFTIKTTGLWKQQTKCTYNEYLFLSYQ